MEDKKKWLKVGTKVSYRPNFGSGAPEIVTIEEIEKCKHEREKYGEPVSKILFANKNFGVFTLTNGHWAYGEQIDAIVD